MTEKFTKLIVDNKPQFQEPLRVASRTNTKKFTPRHVLFKLNKIKEYWKNTGKKHILTVKIKNYFGFLF